MCETRVLFEKEWFFEKEWLKYLWMEKPFTWENGEDIQFSYMAQKYGGIMTYCPPHPESDIDMHSSLYGYEMGVDKKAVVGGTHSGNPVCCAASLANIEFLTSPEFHSDFQEKC